MTDHGDDDHGEEEEEEEAGGGLSQDAVEKAVAGEDDGGDDDNVGLWLETAARLRASGKSRSHPCLDHRKNHGQDGRW